MNLTPNHFKRIRKRFKAYNDRQKFESLKQRLGALKSNLSYCIIDKKSLEFMKIKLEENLKIVNRRIRGHKV
jgi:hypothetical protein